MIQFKDITKVHNNGLVGVKDINFIVEEGEFVFLIGPSGSGKTTLIEMIIRDVIPTYGKVYFNDIDVTKISRKKVYKLRRQIGVVFQDYKLIQEKTAYENIAFAMEIAGKKRKEIKEIVPYVLDIVGLENRMDAFPVQLSGGEQQRVAIARAIANAPKLLIADEPTGNLDPASAWDIVQILSKINSMGTTVLMSTHGTEIVNVVNKRVIQMEKGVLVRDDNKGGYEFGNNNHLSNSKQNLINNLINQQETRSIIEIQKPMYNFDLDTFKNKTTTIELNKDTNKLKFEEPKKQKFYEKFLKLLKKPQKPKKENSIVDMLDPKKVNELEDELSKTYLNQENKNNEADKVSEPKNEEVLINVESEVKLVTSLDKPNITENLELKGLNKKKKLKKVNKNTLDIDNDDFEMRIEESLSKKDDIVTNKIEIKNEKINNDPIDYLNLPKIIIEDLKLSGYKTVNQLLDDGIDKVKKKKNIDEIESKLIEFALEQYLLEN